MWEVDPETKSKLAVLQKRPPNAICCDCGAPSPQWTSPKFGAFICLTCAGLHRGLGVHISFVRSISMDAFKPAEISRLDLGGNKRWQEFWSSKNGGKAWGKPGEGGDGAAAFELEKRYGGDVGEEWKERLGCKVEGKEFTGMPVVERKKMESRGMDGGTARAARAASPLNAAGGASGGGIGSRPQKEMNESFFAKKGSENANRPDGLAPSQGGKYAGFGSGPMPEPAMSAGGSGSMPGADEFQKDPMAALTKGFGWFAGAVGKQAKSVNEGWIQPTAAKIAETDIAKQAQQTAVMAAKGVQSGTKVAAERFNNFVEDTGAGGASSSRSVEPERKDFWDSFGDTGEEKNTGGAIGTAAMRKGGGGGAGKEDKWDNW